MAYRSEANDRRSPCGVSGGNGVSPASSSRLLARLTALATTRVRTLLVLCCLPVPVPNTNASGDGLVPARNSESTSRNTGRILTLRRPASVFDLPTVSQPPAKSTFRHRSVTNSETLKPEKTRVAS